MGLTKQQLEALNLSSFPNNNAGAITPEILRTYNSSSIAATVNQDVYITDSASVDLRLDNLENFSSSLTVNFATVAYVNGVSASLTSTASFNQYTASTNAIINGLATTSSVNSITQSIDSISSSVGLLQTFSGSQYKADSSSFTNIIAGLATTSSVNTLSASIYSTDSTQSNNISSNSSSIGLLQTFSGSQYKNDSSSFDSRILAITSSGGNVSVQEEGTILGNATSFNFIGAGVTSALSAGTASITIPGGGGSINTGSFATTGSNSFTGQQTIQSNNLTFNTTGSNSTNGLSFPNSSIYQNNFLNFATNGDVGVDFSTNNATAGGVNINFRNTNTNGDIQFTTTNGGITLTANGAGKTVSISGSAVSIAGVNFINFSTSVDSRLTTEEFKSTTFATTSSNAFTGQQTITDVDRLNQFTIGQQSGSLVLFGNGFTSSSLSNITASSATLGANIIFKNNNNTADTILSGSNNIFINQAAPTTGFKRYIGGSSNIYLGTAPQLSGSMQFSPIMDNNYSLNGTFNMRGPVTASSGYSIQSNIIAGAVQIGTSATLHAQRLDGLSMGSNYIGGTVNIIANQSNLTGTNLLSNNVIAGGTVTLNLSSSITQFNNNISNAQSVTFTNQYYSSSLGLGTTATNRNNFAGGAQTIIFSGSKIAGTTNPPQIVENFIGGGANIVYSQIGNGRVVGANEYHDANRNMVFGNGLYITGSGLSTDTTSLGSAFFGRWNTQDGSKAKTAETIFAVGTGTATGTRKTGFLIDSGSNVFVEGSLNISGSTSTTGSITIQSGSGDLYVYGHKQFNVGAFTSTITQSGSAAVSQSMLFNTTDISQGVTLNGGTTQMIVANAGVYNIQFSAQIVSDAGADDVWIWLKKNGTNVTNSAGRITLANNEELIAAWNFVVEANANDYFELVWESSGGDAVLLSNTALGNYPAIPSVIATVTQVR